MKPINKFIYHAAVYCVGISLVFFIFARLLNVEELSISFSRYLTIFALSLVMSGAEFILTFDKLPRYLRHTIHYAVLAAAFASVFLTVRRSTGEFEFRAASVFAALAIITLIYVIVTVVFYTLVKSDKAESEKKRKDAPKYTNRFGG